MCQEGGVKKGGTWRTLRVPDMRLGGQGDPDVMDDNILPPERYPENFRLIYVLEVCQEGGYLEDVEGS